MLACIDNPKLDSTASHPSSLSHSLRCHVLCHPGHPMPTIMGGLVLLLMLCLLLLSLSIGRQSVSATVTAVSEPPVTAMVSVTAINGLQLQCHFWLRPKP